MSPTAPRAKKATRTLPGGALRYVRSMMDDDKGWEGDWKAELPNSSKRPSEAILGKSGEQLLVNQVQALPQAEVVDNVVENKQGAAAREIRFDVDQRPLPPIVGFLVSFDVNPSGETYALRQGRWVVSSVPVAVPNSCIVISDKSLSPMHATLRVSAKRRVDVLDQFSESGTFIYRGGTGQQIRVSDSLAVLQHGDVVVFGERHFHVCLIGLAQDEKSQLPAVLNGASKASSAQD